MEDMLLHDEKTDPIPTDTTKKAVVDMYRLLHNTQDEVPQISYAQLANTLPKIQQRKTRQNIVTTMYAEDKKVFDRFESYRRNIKETKSAMHHDAYRNIVLSVYANLKGIDTSL